MKILLLVSSFEEPRNKNIKPSDTSINTKQSMDIINILNGRKQAYNSRSVDKTLHANRHTCPPTLNLRCVTYNNTSKWRWKQTCVTMDIPERQRGSPPPRGVCLGAIQGFPREIEGLRACILTHVWKRLNSTSVRQFPKRFRRTF